MAERVRLLGCDIDVIDMRATVERCSTLIRSPGFHQQTSVNVAKVVQAHDDARLRRIVNGSDLINADGQGVVWASRLLGVAVPARVAGIDLMDELIRLAEEKSHPIYILGAQQEVLETAVARLRREHPRLPIAGYHNGYFSEAENAAVCAEIRDAHPDILFVAMSSPKKEYWLQENGPRLGVPLAMGVGGSIDIVAGTTRRAPVVWQRLGLEWLFRLLQEPRRLLRRYLVGNTKFAWMVIGELQQRRRLGSSLRRRDIQMPSPSLLEPPRDARTRETFPSGINA